MTEKIELPVFVMTAPLTARGYVVFYNLRPDRKTPQLWVCDECGERVILSKQEAHVLKFH